MFLSHVSFRIPDLVKDPEAEAAFEALRGLLESSLQSEYDKLQAIKLEAKRKGPTARKSTSKGSGTNVNKSANFVKKATARKSTGLYNRAGFSYYKVPQEPINFNEISTRMSIGGLEITLNAIKLADMVNLKPVVKVKDCEK